MRLPGLPRQAHAKQPRRAGPQRARPGENL